MTEPFVLTGKWQETSRARATPESYWDPGAGSWLLPFDCDPESARIAIRLFPALYTLRPDIVDKAAVQDVRPVNNSAAAWRDRPPGQDPWQRTAAATPLVPHLYQRQDAQFAIDSLAKCGGAYLGAEAGLGKTLMAAMVTDGWGANFILAVCPNSAKYRTWEPAAALMPWLGEPVVIGNSAKARDVSMELARDRLDNGVPTLIIVHYEALALVDWAPLGVLDLVIFDEGHRLKNHKAKFTKAAMRIPAVGRLFLSGSVLDGDVEDLWVPMKMMQPKRYPTRWKSWNDRFVDYAEGDFGRISLGARPYRIPELRDELGEVLVVRRASDELDIPAPHVQHVDLPMLPVQRTAYKAMVDKLFAELPDGDILAANAGAGLVSALRQVTGGVPLEDGKYASSKLDYIEELVGGPPTPGVGGKPLQTVVFFWHKEPANRLAERLGPLATIVHGDVPQARREEALEDFVCGRRRVLIATIATLSESVNLQCAGRVILAEKSWRPMDNEQSVARVVRQGQRANASVYHLQCPDTVDTLAVVPRVASKTILRRLVVGR